jgi:ABC-type transporter Mla subunit MlaD
MDESQLQDLIQTLESFVAGGPASEATLSKIAEKLGALKKQNDNTGAASKGLKQVAQGAEELDGSFNSLDRAANDVAKAFKKAKSDMLGGGKTVLSGFKSLGGGVEGVITGIKTMISGIAAAAAALVGLIPTMGGLSVAVKAVGEALGAAFSFLLGAAIKTADAFNAVADTGATFGGSLLGMRKAAHDAHQSFESFSKGFLENSAGLTLFAGSATAGAEALSKIQKAVSGDGKGTGLERSLQLMGVSLKDQPAYLGEYLSMLSGSGVQLSNFNDNFTELAKRAVDYRKELLDS